MGAYAFACFPFFVAGRRKKYHRTRCGGSVNLCRAHLPVLGLEKRRGSEFAHVIIIIFSVYARLLRCLVSVRTHSRQRLAEPPVARRALREPIEPAIEFGSRRHSEAQ